VDLEAVRQIVRRRLVSGELPQDSITRFWGGRARGEECDACGERIGPTQIIIEAVSTQTSQGIQFHVGCFHVWDQERDPSGRLDHVTHKNVATVTGYIGEVESVTALSELERLEDQPTRARLRRAFTAAQPRTLPLGSAVRSVTLYRRDLSRFVASLRARVGEERTHTARRTLNRLIIQLVYMSG
jgi:hypothetical protein